MKFLCDQCKAKYQISDDKVAGKTVRMKCRKCGHQIEVRAAVTETSVSSSLPQSDAPPGTIASVRPSAPPGGAAPRPPVGGPRPGGLATSLSAARPAAPRASVNPPGGSGGHALGLGGALAGAFKASVKEGDDSAVAKELLELSSTDEWYCAINGVPVGPIRMTELRRKAALGAVTEDSLVWQEGLEEWRVAKTIPELTAIIREAQATGRPSLVTPQPPDAVGGRVSLPPAAPSPSMRPGTMRSSPAVPRAPEAPRPSPLAAAQASSAAARNNVVPINSRLATAERLDEAPSEMPHERLSIASDPFASPPAAASAAASPFSASASLTAGTSLSFPPPSPAIPAAAALPAPIESRRPSSPPPWILIAMLVLAAAFGVTAAIAIFLRPQQQAAPPPAPVVIQMPAAPQPTQAPVAAAATPADSSSAAAAGSAGKPGVPGKPGAIAANGKPAGSAAGKGVDPSIAALLQGSGNGPSTGGGGGGGGGGGSLTADQVEGVVRNHSLGVRRTCWERGASSSPSANIMVSVSVGGTGNVTNASATGNDPAVAKCIEGAVRSWQFPPTGGSTTVNIPFHFVRQ